MLQELRSASPWLRWAWGRLDVSAECIMMSVRAAADLTGENAQLANDMIAKHFGENPWFFVVCDDVEAHRGALETLWGMAHSLPEFRRLALAFEEGRRTLNANG